MQKHKKSTKQKLTKSVHQTFDDINDPKQKMLEMMTNKSIKDDKKQIDIQENQSGKKKQKDNLWPIFWKFFNYTLKRWKLGLFGFLVSIFSGFLNSMFPLKLGELLDVIAKQTNENNETQAYKMQLKYSMITLAVLTLSIAITTFIRFYALQVFQQKISIDLKQEIYKTFMKNDLYFFEINQSSALISRITNDVNQAKSAISNNLTFLSRSLVTIISSLIVLLIMSWKLTMFLIAMIPLYILINRFYTKKAKKLVKDRQDIEADISQHIGEKFLGISTIKAYGTQQKQISKYNSELNSAYKVQKQRVYYQAIQMSTSTALPSIGAMLVLTFAGIQLLQGQPELTAGQLTSFVLYCNILSMNTNAVSSTYSSIVTGISAMQKVIQMLDYKKQINDEIGQQIELDGNIQFEQVNFKYPKAVKLLFENLTFKINQGEYVGFIGQSGSGKSTITKLILGFYKIQKGNIIFNKDNGANISNLHLKKLRDQIGFVNQQATLFSGNIQENITYGLSDYSVQDIEQATRKSGCNQFLQNKEQFPNGYQSDVGQRGNKLSGGQRQRIAIARALMRKPKILIFDEATSALDSHNQAIVQKSIQQLVKNTNITIIVIAHRLSTVINCDRLYVMKEGTIIENGTHKQLLKQKGYYYSLIEKQLHQNSQSSQ